MKKIIPFRKEIVFKTNISEITSISLEHQLSINELNITGEFMVTGDYKISDKSTTVEPFDLSIPFEIVLDEKYDTSKATCDIDDFYYEIINNSVLSISIDVCVDKLSEILIKDELPILQEKKDIIDELFEEQNKAREINNNFAEVIKESKNEDRKEEIKEEVKEDNRCIEEDDILPGEMGDIVEEEKIEIKKEKNITKEEKIETLESVNEKINSLFSNVGDGDVYVSYNVYIIREGDTVESIIEKYATNEEELKKYNNLSDLKLGDKIIIPAK